eukprot:SAG31_NODE_4046_length_3639_cov_19.403390_1_plen_58_part_10
MIRPCIQLYMHARVRLDFLRNFKIGVQVQYLFDPPPPPPPPPPPRPPPPASRPPPPPA